MSGLHVHMCTVYIPGVQRRPEKAVDPLEPGVTDGCELPCVCWELSLDPLKDQYVPLTKWAICPALFMRYNVKK